VCIEIQSTLTGLEEAKSYAKASMQMRLVSLMTGRVLNRKAQGKSHFKRTKNWRKNLHAGVKAFKTVYEDSAGFYDSLAELKPGKAGNQEYLTEMLAKIESYPGWVDNSDLSFFHKRVKGGGILTLPQKSELEAILASPAPVKPPTPVAPAPKVQIPAQEPAQALSPDFSEEDEVFLARLRKLWVSANRSNDNWYMNISADIGKKMKSGRMSYMDLTQRQLANLEKGFKTYRIASKVEPSRVRKTWGF